MPALPEWLIAIIAGIVEGVTEFLPISSTGHLIITNDILPFDSESLSGTFEIFIQIGAVIAVLLFYQCGITAPGTECSSTGILRKTKTKS